MRSFNISINNQLIRGELNDFLLSQIFTLGTDSFQKDALAWTDLPGAPAGLSGGSCEILPCLTFESGSERAALTCFPGWAAQFSQAMWPASEEGGEVVPAPEEYGPAQPVKEVQRGLVSRSTGHERQVFTRAELRRQLTASPCPLSLHREILAPCLPSIPVQRASWVFPDPLGSAVILCCCSVTETFLAFSPYLQSQVSFYCCTFIPYWTLVSDFYWLCQTGILLWHTFVPEKLCCLHLTALLLLWYLLKRHPFCCLSHGFPLPLCNEIPSVAPFLQLFCTLLLSTATGFCCHLTSASWKSQTGTLPQGWKLVNKEQKLPWKQLCGNPPCYVEAQNKYQVSQIWMSVLAQLFTEKEDSPQLGWNALFTRGCSAICVRNWVFSLESHKKKKKEIIKYLEYSSSI